MFDRRVEDVVAPVSKKVVRLGSDFDVDFDATAVIESAIRPE